MVDGISGFSQVLFCSYPGQGALSLRPGQTFTGIVLEVNSENAVVLLNGINVVAELETKVLPGDKLLLQVLEQGSDGKVLLQKTDFVPGHSFSLADTDLAAVLDYFGIKKSSLSETVVKELLQLKVPVSQRTVELLSSLAQKNRVSQKHIPALAWLWARGLPITKESVTAAAGLMESRFLDHKMEQLFHALHIGIPGETVEILPQSFISQSKTISEVLKQLFLLPGEGPGQWAGKMANAYQKLGLFHEKDLLKVLEEMGKQPQRLFNSKEAGLLDGGNGQTVKALLMDLVRTEGKYGNAGLFNQPASGLVQDITGLQLLHISGQQDGDGVAICMPGWIVTQEKEVQPFLIKLKQYHGSDAACEQNYRCQVLLFIETRAIGGIMCRLVLESGFLTCAFTVRGQEECRFLDSMLPVLKDRLQSMPWKPTIHPCKVSSCDEIETAWYNELFTVQEKSFKGLDARI